MIESIFLAVGINLIPILIWILIIPIIIFKFRSLNKKIIDLLCYFILTCSLMTIISPFEFYTGTLSIFTVSGEVPLGGKIGQNISNLWSWHRAHPIVIPMNVLPIVSICSSMMSMASFSSSPSASHSIFSGNKPRKKVSPTGETFFLGFSSSPSARQAAAAAAAAATVVVIFI